MKKYIKTIGRGILCVGVAFLNTAFMTQNTLSPTPDEGAGENEQDNRGQKICNSLPPTPDYPVRVIKARNSLPPTPDHAVRGICNSLPPTPERNYVTHQRILSPLCFYLLQQKQHTRV